MLVNEETSNTKLYFGHGNSRFDSTNTILIKGKLYIYMNITKKSTHSFNSGCYNTTDWDVSGPPSTQVLPRAGEWYMVTSTNRLSSPNKTGSLVYILTLNITTRGQDP